MPRRLISHPRDLEGGFRSDKCNPREAQLCLSNWSSGLLKQNDAPLIFTCYLQAPFTRKVCGLNLCSPIVNGLIIESQLFLPYHGLPRS